MLNIGIVGTGGMAAQRAKVFHKMEGTSVVSVCSRSRDRAAELCEMTGARACEDYDSLLAEANAVVLCLPNHLHAPYALKAIEKGRHVLVEYPLCIKPDEMKALRAAAEDSGRVLMVGNTMIHETMFQYLMKHRNRLGTLTSASSRVALYDEGIAGHWYLNPGLSGSTFVTYNYHHIEYYRRFLGEIEWVMANDESRPDSERPGYLSIAGGTLTMGHVTGAASCVQWYLSASGSGLPRGFWMNGLRGSVTILSHEKDKSQVVWDDGGEGKVDFYDNTGAWGVVGSCGDFVRAIGGGLDHAARLESDIATLQVGFAAAESARKKELVRLK